MKKQNVVLTSSDINRIITRIAFEIIEKHQGVDKLALIGIQRRGVFLAERIQKKIEEIENIKIPTGNLDINLYRDDWTSIGNQPVVRPTEIVFSVDEHHIILIDDVLFTGRTIRAAMDAILDYGRPEKIELAVLVDRGHRELPIEANYIGRFIETRHSETINVLLTEQDGSDSVILEGK
ncbi:MAG: bifunctional pyr operon transcriptional regulator/uracil phosphoribosyltransferase PyrR [Desulfobacterales bacterium]|nr:bifunctional pyr operon transcriptional regulator/uracil phosphoribosyltransferase PyrR [Desulfobacterales bacterium]MCP4162290.1 bifunctional pyr operon transcriptional regulator/uracil phosphoribosyltransferase PyrR [Deltaproteobacteria bacterium]